MLMYSWPGRTQKHIQALCRFSFQTNNCLLEGHEPLMKLLINTESLAPPLTGIGIYTFNLLSKLHGMQQLETIECFSGIRFQNAQQALAACATDSNHADRTQPPSAGGIATRLKEQLRGMTSAYRAREMLRNAILGMGAKKRKGYIYHEPNFILKAHQGLSIATIHDLSFIHHPQFHPIKRVEWLTSELPKTLDRADFLITDSEQVRQELIDRFGIDEKRVRAIHLGAADCYTELLACETQSTLNTYGLTHGRYLLFVGTLEPRKGVDVLINAWLRLPESMRHEHPLVLAGAPGWKNKELQARINMLTATHGLRHLQFVPAEALPALYAGATLFVYPSLYEGFGLPVLEAMSCGTPVVCTADTAMAEFSEGATALCMPGNYEHLADVIQTLLEDSETRTGLSQAGLTRAKRLSWQRCADETLSIYRLISSDTH